MTLKVLFDNILAQKEGMRMDLFEIIKYMYGSVDKMIEINKSSLSRAYIYQILKGEKKNLTLQAAYELKEMLNIKTLDDLYEILKNTGNYKTIGG